MVLSFFEEAVVHICDDDVPLCEEAEPLSEEIRFIDVAIRSLCTESVCDKVDPPPSSTNKEESQYDEALPLVDEVVELVLES